MVSSHKLEEQRLSTLYGSLPRQQRHSLLRQAEEYVASLDKAIAQYLAPDVDRDGENYLVTDEIIPIYGVGPTVEEAMDDYRSALVEYYDTLEEDADRLAKHLREQLELLRRVFAPSGER
jgi:isopenicillin N synthase-like dioxygenase